MNTSHLPKCGTVVSNVATTSVVGGIADAGDFCGRPKAASTCPSGPAFRIVAKREELGIGPAFGRELR